MQKSKNCQSFFISATNTNIGKTYVTLRLMEFFAKKGYKVGAFKPIETGVDKIPPDGEKLLKKAKELNKNFNDIDITDIVPIMLKLPASPFVAKNNRVIDFNKIDKSFKKLKKRCNILFIEGAGGLMVPVDKKFFMVDFISYFDAKALLVTPGKLGCINDTLLSLKLLDERNLSYSWCINLKRDEKDNFLKTTLPYYKFAFKNPIILPWDLETLWADMINYILH